MDEEHELALYLLDLRHPGVLFEPADEFPGFHLPDPEPIFAHARPG